MCDYRDERMDQLVSSLCSLISKMQLTCKCACCRGIVGTLGGPVGTAPATSCLSSFDNKAESFQLEAAVLL